MFKIDKPPTFFVKRESSSKLKKSLFLNVMKHETQLQLWKKHLSVERKFKNSPV